MEPCTNGREQSFLLSWRSLRAGAYDHLGLNGRKAENREKKRPRCPLFSLCRARHGVHDGFGPLGHVRPDNPGYSDPQVSNVFATTLEAVRTASVAIPFCDGYQGSGDIVERAICYKSVTAALSSSRGRAPDAVRHQEAVPCQETREAYRHQRPIQKGLPSSNGWSNRWKQPQNGSTRS
jgi:hypothetical protein